MRNGFRFAFFICTCVSRTLLCTLQTMQGLASSTARTCLPVHSCGNHTKFGTLFQNAIRHIYTILRNITTKNYCTNPDNPTNGGRGEQRSPAFIRLHGLYKFTPPATPRNGTSYFCKAEIALLPYRYSGKFLPPQNRSALCGYTFCFGIE